MKIEQFSGSNRFLSNFFPCLVSLNGVDYASVEHAYQAAKTLDAEERETVRQMPTAGKAKRAGKKVTLRADWPEVKISIMADLLRQKFGNNNASLRAELLSTGNSELIEGNNWGDQFWGICNGVGRNELGKAIMRVRQEVISGSEAMTQSTSTSSLSH